MHKWYVVQVLSGQEKKAKRALEELSKNPAGAEYIQEVLIPTENVSEVKKGQQRISEKKVWPGYLLVRMILDDDSWMLIKNSAAVLGFLGGSNPAPLEDAEVERILKDFAQKQGVVVPKHNIVVGDSVKIVDGVFVTFIGSVREVDHARGRVCVEVSIFGRPTRVDDLEFWQVEILQAEG